MKVPQNYPADYSPSLPDDLTEDAEELSQEGSAVFAPAITLYNIPGDCAGLRLDQALARLMPQHSRSRLQGWLREGRILLAGKPGLDARHKVWGGERIELLGELVDPREQVAQAENIPLVIVYEDDEIIVINKPAGLVVHPGSGNWQGTLLNALLYHAPALAAIPRAGIVHRLDKDTTGLMVVAKTLAAQTDLVRQLEARSVRRHYLALVLGEVLTGGSVDAPIGRHPTQRTRMAVVPAERHGRPARTHYSVCERFDDVEGAKLSLLECRLETGRTHQIRVHLSSIGHPLVGDPVYGRTPARLPPLLATFPRQALHAWQLALRHPGHQREMAWEVEIPGDFAGLLQAVKSLKYFQPSAKGK